MWGKLYKWSISSSDAKIELHVRMWPPFPACGPDVRLPGEDSRNVTASFFGASLLLPIWRSLPLHALLGSEKQEWERGWYKSLRNELSVFSFLKKAFAYVFFGSYLQVSYLVTTSLSLLLNMIKINGGSQQMNLCLQCIYPFPYLTFTEGQLSGFELDVGNSEIRRMFSWTWEVYELQRDR